MILAALDSAVEVAIFGAVGVVVGSLISALVTMMSSRAARESEERRVIYDIASKIAMEQWKLDVETTKARNEEIKVPDDRIGLFRLDIPRAADTVKSVMDQLQSTTRRKSMWARFHEWRSNKKNEEE